MKRNKALYEYGQKMVTEMQKIDGVALTNIRMAIRDVSVFTRGVVELVGIEIGKPNGRFDYQAWDRRWRGYLGRITTQARLAYTPIIRHSKKLTKDIYSLYRNELSQTLGKIESKPKTVPFKEETDLSMGGTVTQSLEGHIRRQLQAGLDPAALITTVSQEHVKLIQSQLLLAVSQGKGFGWSTQRVLSEMFPQGVSKDIEKKMEYNITRIMRTSYMNAVNLDVTEFVADNPNAFYGSIRVADGVPCMACVMLDGTYYPPGAILEPEHPNGMCILVPLLYPSQFLESGQITSPTNDLFGMSLTEKLLLAGALYQKQKFQNDKLFELWQEELFDLDDIVTSGGTPISYQSAVVNMEKMGGISTALVGFESDEQKEKLNPIIDPKDRKERGKTIVVKKPRGVGKNKYGIDLVGDGSDFLNSSLPNKIKAKIQALYGDGKISSYYRFNKRAREVGIWTRMAITGLIYYVVPDDER